MKRCRYLNRAEQLAAFAKVKRLQAGGFSLTLIANEMRGSVTYPTIQNWMRRTKPPAPRGMHQFHRCERHRVILNFETRDAVPANIGGLRDRLIQAFMSGNMEEHARLCQEMHKQLVEAKLHTAVLPLSVLAVIPALLEAAE